MCEKYEYYMYKIRKIIYFKSADNMKNNINNFLILVK